MSTLEAALLKAEKWGAQYAEVRFHKNFSSQLIMLNGNIISNEQDSSSGYSLRTYREGHLDFYSDDTSPPEPTSTPIGRGWEVGVDLHGEVGNVEFSYEGRQSFREVDLAEKLELLKGIFDQARALKLNSKLERLTLNYWEGVEEKEVVNSIGLRLRSRVGRVGLWYSFTLKEGDKYITASVEEFGNSGGFEKVKEWRAMEAIAERIRSVDDLVSRGKAPSPGKKDVIVSGMIAGIIAHESGGHPFEADRVLEGRRHRRGEVT